ALRAQADLLRSRASLLQAPQAAQGTGGAGAPLGTWIAGEAALAERLQVARDLVFDAADAALARRETAILLHVIDLRDVLLASRLDLELLGTGATATRLLERVAAGLRQIAVALDQIGDALRDDRPPAPDAAGEAAMSRPFEDVAMPEADPRRRLLPTLARRLELLRVDVAAMHRLALGQEEVLPLSRSQLQSFVGPETWPLEALRRQLSRSSPVLRHAVRMGLALATAYFVARVLPWASHPHWLVLSVAVVLRGNLEQTLTRRNARVLGTMFGCLLVLLFARSNSPPLLELVFLGSVGIAHSFVNVRYWVTATAATVMALLQSHLADPAVGFAIGERLADTVLGAALGWGFSYVLPSWERHSVPQAIARALAALDEYATRVLAPDAGSAVEQRLARRTAYDALGALAGAAQRSAVEPRRARLPIDDMAALLDHGQRLMAHLSSIRLMLARGTAQLREPSAAAALQAASKDLSDVLTRQGLPDASGSAPDARWVDALPQEPPSNDLLPWLLRRLQLSLHDARRVRGAASAALARLA
ncbi:MAG TPA: FUSC family protein, partial [Caldimonas sp.]